MPGPLRRPLVLFLTICGLILIYFGLHLNDWGQEHSHHIAVLRDDLGSPRKDALLKKLDVPGSGVDLAIAPPPPPPPPLKGGKKLETQKKPVVKKDWRSRPRKPR